MDPGRKRTFVVVLVLAAVVSLTGGVLGSLLADTMPPAIRQNPPLLYFLAVAFILVAAAVFALERKEAGVEPVAGEPPVLSCDTEDTCRKAYLDYLIDQFRYLDFRGMGFSDRVPLRLELRDMYVPLKARVEVPEGETWARDLRLAGRKLASDEAEAVGRRLSEPVPLIELLKKHDGLIVLGDPGAGKTTFLKFVALHQALNSAVALGMAPRLPILLPLAAYARTIAGSDMSIGRFIEDYYGNRDIADGAGRLMKSALENGQALVLLDGLDEVRDGIRRRQVMDRAMEFFTVQRRHGNKFIMTSRIVGYKELRPAAFDGLAECTLVDFDDEEIAAFAGKWTSAIERAASGRTRFAAQEAEREKRELLEAVNRNPGVRRLAANPLLLTVLALMKRQGVTLPERRVELYQKYVETLIKHWNLARGLDRGGARDMDVVATQRILAPLALWMHETSPGVGRVPETEARTALAAIFAERGEGDPQDAAVRFVEDIRMHTGLLVLRGPREFGFIHLTFQEYLAAVAIAQKGQQEIGPILDYFADRMGDDNWHEVFLLTVAYIGIIQQREAASGELLARLVQEVPGPPGQAVVWAGNAVVDAGPQGVTSKAAQRVKKALFRTMIDQDRVPANLRAGAGRVAGQLGDDRPGVGVKGGLPDIDWIGIPAGPFIMGSDKAVDNEAYDYELPQFECRLIDVSYRIARYPVTVAQFGLFTKAGGYGERHYWNDAGWKWREEKKIDGPRIIGGLFETLNHPQVGVSWYEAMAFCNWLAEKLGFAVTLPTEAQWERAARHTDGRIFPWGDELDPQRCNMGDTGIGATSAVGIFPLGRAKCGVMDMAGNVFEWCLSRSHKNYQGYEAEAKVLDEVEGDAARVLRGGCFFDDRRFVRCAFRNIYSPHNRDNYTGFRPAAPGL